MALPVLRSIGYHARTNKQYSEDLYQHMGYLITITGLEKLAQGREEESKYLEVSFHSFAETFKFLPLRISFWKQHDKDGDSAWSVLGTFRLLRRLLNTKHILEVLIRTTTDVQKLPNYTGIQKSENLCWGLATAKQTLAPGKCGTFLLA